MAKQMRQRPSLKTDGSEFEGLSSAPPRVPVDKSTAKAATPATPSKLRTKLGDERRNDSLNLKVRPTLRDAFSKHAAKANMTKADLFEAMVLDWIENNK